MKAKPELRRCYVCEGLMSSDAPACPHCGQSYRRSASPAAIIAFVLLVAIALWIVSAGQKSNRDWKALMQSADDALAGKPTPVPMRLVK